MSGERVIELSEDQFNAALRAVILNAALAEGVFVASRRRLAEFGMEPDADFAQTSVPATGSSQTNTRSLLDWMDTIGKDDQAAKKQLFILASTALTRIDVSKLTKPQADEPTE